MSDLLVQVRRTIDQHRLLSPGDRLVVGVSGGPDSLCLLHLLCRLRDDYHLALHVAHLHHGLRGPDADADARFVADLAAGWDLPCTVERADVPALAAASRPRHRGGRPPRTLRLPRPRRGIHRRCRRRRRPQCRRPGRDCPYALDPRRRPRRTARHVAPHPPRRLPPAGQPRVGGRRPPDSTDPASPRGSPRRGGGLLPRPRPRAPLRPLQPRHHLLPQLAAPRAAPPHGST